MNARKKGKDIFANTERTLLNDIVAKIKVVEDLREEVNLFKIKDKKSHD